MSTPTQEFIDRFYWAHGPCCAGCDWWRHFNTRVGECTKSAPVAQSERWAMIGMTNISLSSGAGHIGTPREHRCGDFKDEFDWSSLPLAYQRGVGARTPPMPANPTLPIGTHIRDNEPRPDCNAGTRTIVGYTTPEHVWGADVPFERATHVWAEGPRNRTRIRIDRIHAGTRKTGWSVVG